MSSGWSENDRKKVLQGMRQMGQTMFDKMQYIPYLMWKAKIASYKPDAPREYIITQRDHRGKYPGELTCKQGEKLKVLGKDPKSERILGELENGHCGWLKLHDDEKIENEPFKKKKAQYAQATYDWVGLNPSQLTFRKGEKIKVLAKDRENERFLGLLHGVEGWVYLRKPTAGFDAGYGNVRKPEVVSNKTKITRTVTEVHHHSEIITASEDYEAQNSNEVSVKKGDKLLVLEKGNTEGRVFVQVKRDGTADGGPKGWMNIKSSQFMPTRARKSIVSHDSSLVAEEWITPSFDHNGTVADELSFKAGNRIRILDKDSGKEGYAWGSVNGTEGFVTNQVFTDGSGTQRGRTKSTLAALMGIDQKELEHAEDYASSTPRSQALESLNEQQRALMEKVLKNLAQNLCDSGFMIPFLKWRGAVKAQRAAEGKDTTGRQFVVAWYDYIGKNPTELSFRKGHKIKVVAKDEVGGRFLGEGPTGKTGWVSLARFAIQFEDQKPKETEEAQTTEVHHHYHEVIIATYDYEAKDAEELSFKVGDRVTVLDKGTDGRCYGEIDGNKGWFRMEIPDGKNEEVKHEVEWFVPSFDYSAKSPEEITFSAGMKIKVLNKDPNDEMRFFGELENGARGWASMVPPKKVVVATPMMAAASGAELGNVSDTGFLTAMLSKKSNQEPLKTAKPVGAGLLSGMFAGKEKAVVNNFRQTSTMPDKPTLSFATAAGGISGFLKNSNLFDFSKSSNGPSLSPRQQPVAAPTREDKPTISFTFSNSMTKTESRGPAMNYNSSGNDVDSRTRRMTILKHEEGPEVEKTSTVAASEILPDVFKSERKVVSLLSSNKTMAPRVAVVENEA